jgi:hypothetical protein
MYTKR